MRGDDPNPNPGEHNQQTPKELCMKQADEPRKTDQ